MGTNLLHNIFIPLFLIIPGWTAGGLINYLADTLPVYRRPFSPVCYACGQSWNWRNYLLFDKCTHCRVSPPMRHRITQFVFVTAVVFMWFLPPPKLGFFWAIFLFFYFGIVFIIDIEHRLILHTVSMVGIVIGGTYGIIHHGIIPTLLGAFAGFAIMLGLYLFGILFSKLVTRVRKQPVEEVALGFGDVTLSAVLGCLLGWPGITAGLMLAIIFGGLFSLIYILVKITQKKYHLLSAIPYGPFLILSAIVLLFRY